MFECFVLHKSLKERDGIWYSFGFEETEELAAVFCATANLKHNYGRPVKYQPKGYDPEWWSK